MLRLIKNEFIKNFALLRSFVIITAFIIFSFMIVQNSFRYTQKPILIGSSDTEVKALEESKDKYAKEATNNNLYDVYLHTLNAELEGVTNKLTMYVDGWQQRIIEEVKMNNNRLATLSMLKDGIKADSFDYGIVYKNATDEEIDDEYDTLLLSNNQNVSLLKTDSYYEYLKIEINNLKEQNKSYKDEPDKILFNNDLIKIKQYIVDNKIKYDNDIKVSIQKELEELINLKDYRVLLKTEFYKDYNLKYTYKTYENYMDKVNSTKAHVKDESKKLWYAMEHGIEVSNGTKDSIKDAYQLLFIVALGSVICYAGIISKEFKSGSIRLLLTQGPKRYKILLSKYLMMILSTYILYFICILVYLFLVLRMGSLSDLTPQLIMFNGTPYLINYFLYLFIETIIYGLPLIFIMTLVFLITVISNGVIIGTIVGIILSALSILSSSLLYLVDLLKLYFLKYVPFSYMNLYFFDPDYTGNYYMSFIFNKTLGIIVLVISIILMYMIAHLIFTKRDVRN